MGSHEVDLGVGSLYKMRLKSDGVTVISKEEVKKEEKTGFHGLSRYSSNFPQTSKENDN